MGEEQYQHVGTGPGPALRLDGLTLCLALGDAVCSSAGCSPKTEPARPSPRGPERDTLLQDILILRMDDLMNTRTFCWRCPPRSRLAVSVAVVAGRVANHEAGAGGRGNAKQRVKRQRCQWGSFRRRWDAAFPGPSVGRRAGEAEALPGNFVPL